MVKSFGSVFKIAFQQDIVIFYSIMLNNYQGVWSSSKTGPFALKEPYVGNLF